MRIRTAIVIAIAVGTAACGILLPGTPGWCGAPVTPGLFQPGTTPVLIQTSDPDRLLCIAVENRSDVDFAFVESSGAGRGGSALVAACSGMAVSQSLTDGWELAIGPGNATGISGSTAARFEASRLRGGGPYLVTVVIHPDRTASIDQVDALPPNPATTLC